MSGAGPSPQTNLGNLEDRITLWNTSTKRKLVGNSAPKRRNLSQYLATHPHIEVYTDQAEQLRSRDLASRMNADLSPRSMAVEGQKRVSLWHKKELRRLNMRAGPMRKNLDRYLQTNPEWEVYDDQDVRLETLRSTPVPLWHTTEKRKLAMCEAPPGKDVKSFLADHSEWEIYIGQDGVTLQNGNIYSDQGYLRTPNGTVVMWDPDKRKIASPGEYPLPSELLSSLIIDATLEIYKGQDKIPPVAAPRGSTGPTNRAYRRMGHKRGADGLFTDNSGRVLMWDSRKRSKVGGSAAPLPLGIDSFIQRNPHLEVYRGQNRENTLIATPSGQSNSTRASLQRERRALDIDLFCTTNIPISSLPMGEIAPSRPEELGQENDDIMEDDSLGSVIDEFIND